METLKQIHEARKKIKEGNFEKLGYNTYSSYKYFTPEQISDIVSSVCDDLKLFNKFDLLRTDHGLMARLEVINLDGNVEDSVIFDMATEIPEITATNAAQQLGGCVTYSERYLLQVAYDIKDNNLDFDTEQNKGKKEEEKNELPWLNPSNKEKWAVAVERLANGTMESVTKYYRVSKANQEKLKTEALNFVKP